MEAMQELEVPTDQPKTPGVVINKAEAVEEITRIDLSATEKLSVRDMENAFLKGQVEIRRLQDEAQKTQQQFPALVQGFVKKYGVDTANFVFDSVELCFKKKQ